MLYTLYFFCNHIHTNGGLISIKVGYIFIIQTSIVMYTCYALVISSVESHLKNVLRLYTDEYKCY